MPFVGSQVIGLIEFDVRPLSTPVTDSFPIYDFHLEGAFARLTAPPAKSLSPAAGPSGAAPTARFNAPRLSDLSDPRSWHRRRQCYGRYHLWATSVMLADLERLGDDLDIQLARLGRRSG